MKKVVKLMTLVLLMTSTGMFAQKKDNADKKAKREAVLIEKLDLTDSESKDLFATQKAMKVEMKANREAFKKSKPNKDQKLDDMSDAEVTDMINSGFEMKQNALDIRKKYNDKYIAIIGVKRTAKMYHIIREHRKGSKQKPGTPPTPPTPPAPTMHK